MAKRKDMKNLVVRNGWYHFRGYVPKDLIAIGHPKERTFSLNTAARETGDPAAVSGAVSDLMMACTACHLTCKLND